MEQEAIEILKSIDKKLTQKKKDFWDILGLASTFISTVIITFIGLYINQQSKKEEHLFQKEASEKEAAFRKTELIEKFSPLLFTDDSIKNKVAIVGMYTLDSNLALQLAAMINSPGTQSAVRVLFKNVDSDAQRSIEKVLVSTSENTITDITKANDISQIALNRAVSQIGVKEDPSNSNDGPEIKKYFIAIGMNSTGKWSAAFVVWCYLYSPEIENKLAYMKTGSNMDLYNRLKRKGQILDIGETPKPGDIVFYDWDGNGIIDHCGIVYQYDKDLIYTIEGNVADANSSIGGEVMKRVRKLASVCAYGRIE